MLTVSHAALSDSLTTGDTFFDSLNNSLFIGTLGPGTLTISPPGPDTFSFIAFGDSATGTGLVSGDGAQLIATNVVNVGHGADGTLSILNGGSVISQGGASPFLDCVPCNATIIGNAAGTTGNLLVSGPGSSFVVQSALNPDTGFFIVGNGNVGLGFGMPGADTVGTFLVENGATATTTGTLIGNRNLISGQSQSTGFVSVDGAGSVWTVTRSSAVENPSFINVGNRGDGTLSITDGGVVNSTFVSVGRREQATGVLVIDGVGSTLNMVGGEASGGAGLTVGNAGGASGSALVSNGGRVLIDATGFNAGGMTIGGLNGPAQGFLTVTGAGSLIDITGDGASATNSPGFTVGRSGLGALDILDGGRIVVNDNSAAGTGGMAIGGNAAQAAANLPAGTGTVRVSGTNSALEINAPRGGFTAGRSNGGIGTLLIDDGGLVRGAFGTAGREAGSTGVISVSGANSRLELNTAESDLTIGRDGDGGLFVDGGGKVRLGDPDNPNTVNFDPATMQLSGSDGAISSLAVGFRGGTGAVVISGAGSEVAAPSVGLALTTTDTEGVRTLSQSEGAASLSVLDGGTLRAQLVAIGQNAVVGGNGTIVGRVFNVGGIVSPGTSPGTLLVQGDYLQTAGLLALEIAGRNAGQFDQLKVTGSASLQGGTVSFVFDGFTPQSGDQFLLIDAAGGVSVGGGVALSVAGLPADFFGNDLAFAFENGLLRIFQPAQQQAQQQAQAIEQTSEVQTRASVVATTTIVTGRLRALLSGFGPLGRGFSQPANSRIAPQGATGTSGGDPNDPMQRIGVWLDGGYSRIDDRTPNGAFDARVYTTLAGADMVIGDRLVLGAGFGYEYGDTSFRSQPGDRESDTYTGLAYAAYVLDDVFTLAAQASIGRAGNDIDQLQLGQRVSGDFDSRRYLAGAQLLARQGVGDWEFVGTAGYTYAKESFDSYVASNRQLVSPEATRVGLFRLSGEVSHYFGSVAPYLGVSWDYDHYAGDRNDSAGEARDATGMEVEVGVRLELAERLSGGLAARHEFTRKNQDNYGAGVNLRYQF